MAQREDLATIRVNPSCLLLSPMDRRCLIQGLKQIAQELEAGEHAGTAIYFIPQWQAPSAPRAPGRVHPDAPVA